MLVNKAQLNKTLDRLVAKTRDGSIQWSRGFMGADISARLDDYQVSLSRSTLGFQVVLTISDISSGSSIKYGGEHLLALPLTPDRIDAETQSKINDLYKLATTREDALLDGFLKALG